MNDLVIPERFRDLVPYVPWALPTERERRARRLASSIDEIRAFYDAMAAQMEDIIGYLNQYPYADMPPDASRLCDMGLALVEVSNVVERYKRPEVMNAMAPERFLPYE